MKKAQLFEKVGPRTISLYHTEETPQGAPTTSIK